MSPISKILKIGSKKKPIAHNNLILSKNEKASTVLLSLKAMDDVKDEREYE